MRVTAILRQQGGGWGLDLCLWPLAALTVHIASRASFTSPLPKPPVPNWEKATSRPLPSPLLLKPRERSQPEVRDTAVPGPESGSHWGGASPFLNSYPQPRWRRMCPELGNKRCKRVNLPPLFLFFSLPIPYSLPSSSLSFLSFYSIVD